MANVISLHMRQVFLSAGEPAAYGQAYFYQSGTETQVNVYSDVDLLSVRPQPVTLDADGVLPVCYIGSPDPLRILVTDDDDVALPGYPMDNVIPLTAEAAAANTVGFSPTDEIPETNVQSAIEAVAALFADQASLIARSATPYVTGGTGNAYTITPTPAITAYTSGQSFLVRPDRANTATATLNVNGLGARNIYKTNAAGTPIALVAGEIQPGREFQVYDDGTYLLMVLGRDFPISASNANGRYWRFANGIQICTKTLTGQGPISTALGSLFQSSLISLGSWPAAFVGIDYVDTRSGHTTAHSWTSTVTAATTSAGPQVIMLRSTTSAATDYTISALAFGRWF